MLEKAIQDKCGVIGVLGIDRAAAYAHFGLYQIQHRGQESAGIVTTENGKFHIHTGMGLIHEIFEPKNLRKLKGRAAIGHTKYTTQGASALANVQPLAAKTQHGKVAIAHNGEISNHETLRKKLETQGAPFSTSSDTEVVLQRFARASAAPIEKILEETFEGVNPSYSIVMLTQNQLIAIRDPSGVRPLEIGMIERGKDRAYVFASETVALDSIKARHIGEVGRGELVIADENGLRRKQLFPPAENLPCIFEHIYFGHPASLQFGCKVANSAIREEFGRQLYREHPIEADIVSPIPDSSNAIALGFSKESGIPLNFALTRHHYMGRTFIEPTQTLRDIAVLRKFNVNRSVVENQRVVLVDDSIVRGTTMKRLIKVIRSFGASEVHVRIGSPPYRHSCYLGIDTPETGELIASQRSIEETRAYIKADSLKYLSIEGMLSNSHLNNETHCTQCFDGKVIIPKR